MSANIGGDAKTAKTILTMFNFRILFLLMVLAGITGCKWGDSAGAKKDGPPSIMISAVSAHRGDIGVYVNALGMVTPVSTVSIKSRVDGQLMAVNYQEGQTVSKGDSLVEIDEGPYQAALTQATGQLARDTALLENARLDLKRYQDAYTRNAIPKQQLDTQVSTVHQYEGTVQLDQGQMDNAKIQLAYCHITAPVSGRVGLRLVDPGNIVHASDTNSLVVITQLKPITVIFSVAEDYLPQIQVQLKKGEPLTVEAYDRTQSLKLATGTLLTLDNQIDTTTGTDKLKAVFANPEEKLFPNQFVNIHLILEERPNALVVPGAAIQTGTQGTFVWAVQADNTVKNQPVKIALAEGQVTILDSGVNPGDKVVVDGADRLRSGASVIVSAPRQGRGGQAGGGAPGGGSGAPAPPWAGKKDGQGAAPAAGGEHKWPGKAGDQPRKQP